MLRKNPASFFSNPTINEKMNCYLAYYEASLPTDLPAVEKLARIKTQRELLLNGTFVKTLELDPAAQDAAVNAKQDSSNATSFVFQLAKVLGPRLLEAKFPVLKPLLFLAQLMPTIAKMTPQQILKAAQDLKVTYKDLPIKRYSTLQKNLLALGKHERVLQGQMEVGYQRLDSSITHKTIYEYASLLDKGMGCNNVSATALADMETCMKPGFGKIIAGGFPIPAMDYTRDWHTVNDITIEGVKAKLAIFNHALQIGQHSEFGQLMVDCHNKVAPCLDAVQAAPLPTATVANATAFNITDSTTPANLTEAAKTQLAEISPDAIGKALLASTALFAAASVIYLATQEEPKKTHNYNLRPRHKRD